MSSFLQGTLFVALIVFIMTCMVVMETVIWLHFGPPSNVLSLTGMEMIARESCAR